jgi:6-phosphofructokinase
MKHETHGCAYEWGDAPAMKIEDGCLQALHVLKEHEIEALVIIGGGGSQTGAHALITLSPS